MAMKKVIDLDASTTVKMEKPGQKFSGYYIGAKNVTTSMGPSVLQIFQTDKGNVGVWGSAQLNGKLQQVPAGSLTEITYLSKVKVPKGTMKKFEVQFDDTDTINVAGAQVNFNPGTEPESDEESSDDYADEAVDYADDSSAEDEEVEAPKAALPRAAAPAARQPAAASKDRQKAVNDLLNKPRASR